MRTLPLLAVVLLLASCGRDRCDAELVTAEPLVGSADVPLDATIEFELDDVEGDETVTLLHDGQVVAGTTTVEGLRVVFQPDEPLEPDTRYEAEIDGACGWSTAFTTADGEGGDGDPVEDPDALVGSTYLIDLSEAESVEPQLFEMMLSASTEDLALGVEGLDSDELHAMTTVVTTPGVQDPCVPTNPLPAADWDNPEFDMRTMVPVPLGSGGFALNELRLSGRFSSDGAHIDDTTIQAEVDLRVTEDPFGACLALAFTGSPCIPCADGEEFCVEVVIEAGRSDRIDGWTLVPRTPEQIAVDPTCN